VKWLLVLVGFLMLAAPAQAQLTLRYADGLPAPALQAWVDASNVPVAVGGVTIHRAHCFVGLSGSCTTAPGDEIWLKAQPSRLRVDLAHELGHRFDYRVMTDAARIAFGRLIADQRPWHAEPNSPHEKFAEAYGLCFRHRRITRAPAEFGYDFRPGPVRHRRVCRLIRQTAVGVFGSA
jgi:hypothetical protein